jgi:hypothetical protein
MATAVRSNRDHGGIARLTGIPDPFLPSDAATMGWVESVIADLKGSSTSLPNDQIDNIPEDQSMLTSDY